MAKVFLSYPFTGEDLGSLSLILTKFVNALESNSHDVFCALLCKEKIDELGILGYEARLQYCLEQQAGADIVIAIILGNTPSNGMQKELQQAMKTKQPYLLFIKRGLEYPEFRNYAIKVIEYASVNELEKLTHTIIDESKDSLYSVVA